MYTSGDSATEVKEEDYMKHSSRALGMVVTHHFYHTIRSCVFQASLSKPTMASLSYLQVEAILSSPKLEPSICCIALFDGSRCKNELPSDQVQEALNIIRKDKSPSLPPKDQVKQVRTLISSLVCGAHWEHPKCRKLIEAAWSVNFSDLNFEISTRCTRPRSARSSPAPSTPLKKTTSDQSTPTLTVRSRSPSEARRSRSARGSSEVPNDRHSIERPTFRGGSQYRQARDLSMESDEDDGQRDADLSPSLVRSRGIIQSIEDDGNYEGSHTAAAVMTTSAISPLTVTASPDSQDPDHDFPVKKCCTTSSAMFTHGDGYESAPWRIRQEVRTRLLESLPDKFGTIYIIPDKTNRYVKIGKTERRFLKTRLLELVNDHKDLLDKGKATHVTNIPLFLLTRLEDLVHADLAFFQRNLRGNRNQTHHEWFEVDVTTAEETVILWLKVLKSMKLKPGGGIKYKLREQLNHNDYFDTWAIDDKDVDGVFQEVNGDHAARISKWKELLPAGNEVEVPVVASVLHPQLAWSLLILVFVPFILYLGWKAF